MTASVIDGKALAQRTREETARRVAALRARGHAVRLDAVLAGDDDTSPARVYAQSQARTCAEVGIDYHLHDLGPLSRFGLDGGVNPPEDAYELVKRLSADARVHAIMVHLPLPAGADVYTVQNLIHPDKDVEGVNASNIGNIVYGKSSLAPCTALATLEMIRSTGIELRGKRAVVVGASNIVGKPIAVMLMRHEATVVSCNEFTDNITDLTRQADVLVAAAGVPGLVKGNWVKPGAVVIDVGINRVKGPDGKNRTVGDVEFDEVARVAGAASPVPGGVGPMTVAMLLANVVWAAEKAAEG